MKKKRKQYWKATENDLITFRNLSTPTATVQALPMTTPPRPGDVELIASVFPKPQRAKYRDFVRWQAVCNARDEGFSTFDSKEEGAVSAFTVASKRLEGSFAAGGKDTMRITYKKIQSLAIKAKNRT